MTVTMDQVLRGVQSYYETEFCQKASGVDKFAAYFMLPVIPNIVKKKLDAFKGSPLVDDLINSDGLVEIDTVRERAAAAMQHCGSLDIMGFRLNVDDIDRLYESIRRS